MSAFGKHPQVLENPVPALLLGIVLRSYRLPGKRVSWAAPGLGSLGEGRGAPLAVTSSSPAPPGPTSVLSPGSVGINGSHLPAAGEPTQPGPGPSDRDHHESLPATCLRNASLSRHGHGGGPGAAGPRPPAATVTAARAALTEPGPQSIAVTRTECGRAGARRW